MWPERTRLSISMLCVWREGSDRESRRFNQVSCGRSVNWQLSDCNSKANMMRWKALSLQLLPLVVVMSEGSLSSTYLLGKK